MELARLPNFSEFFHHFSKDPYRWKSIYDSSAPHLSPFPDEFETKLNGFHRLLLLRCLRPDKMPEAIQHFVTLNLGRKFIDPPPWDLQAYYSISSPTAPIIIILSPGANPTEEINKLSNSLGMKKRIVSISFGQQQGPIAEKAITEAMLVGNWVLLQVIENY